MTDTSLTATEAADARGRTEAELAEGAMETDLPKIGAPALRALASIGVRTMSDLKGHDDAELLALHGFGPKALRILKEHGAR